MSAFLSLLLSSGTEQPHSHNKFAFHHDLTLDSLIWNPLSHLYVSIWPLVKWIPPQKSESPIIAFLLIFFLLMLNCFFVLFNFMLRRWRRSWISNFRFYQNVSLNKVLCKAESNVPTAIIHMLTAATFQFTSGRSKNRKTYFCSCFEWIRKFDIELKFFEVIKKPCFYFTVTLWSSLLLWVTTRLFLIWTGSCYVNWSIFGQCEKVVIRWSNFLLRKVQMM